MTTSDRLFLLVPSLVLTSLATYTGATGLASSWWPEAPMAAAVPISAALHAAWLGAVFRRRALVAGALCWLVAANLSVRGSPGAATPAVLLETIPLLLALAANRIPLPDRLAQWRRTRARIRAELEQSTGLVPWLRTCTARFLHNGDRGDSALDRARLLIQMADAEQVAAAANMRRTQ